MMGPTLRKALAGTSVVHSTVDAITRGLKLHDSSSFILLDIHGYDGFPAQAMMCKGPSILRNPSRLTGPLSAI